jgi:hypothetical protein
MTYEPTPGKAFAAWEAQRNANVAQSMAQQINYASWDSAPWEVYASEGLHPITKTQEHHAFWVQYRNGSATIHRLHGAPVAKLEADSLPSLVNAVQQYMGFNYNPYRLA